MNMAIKMNDKIVQKYLKDVENCLHISRSMKSVFVHELKDSVTSFVEGNENITLEMLLDEFGTPEDISAGFSDRRDYEELLKKADKKARVWRYVGILAFLIIIVVVCFAVFAVNKYGGDVYVSNTYISK